MRNAMHLVQNATSRLNLKIKTDRYREAMSSKCTALVDEKGNISQAQQEAVIIRNYL